MEYYFNELNPVSFQRLFNAVLTAIVGERIRLTPLYGPDDARDAEILPGAFLAANLRPADDRSRPGESLAEGRYIFQVKFHRTTEARLSDVRTTVVSDFRSSIAELQRRKVSFDFFFLVTNVSASKDAIRRIDARRKLYSESPHSLFSDIWWGERITAYLDLLPELWLSFPELFPGRVPPLLADLISDQKHRAESRAVQSAISYEFRRDESLQFRQIELEKDLLRLFVDLDVEFATRPRWEFSTGAGYELSSFEHFRTFDRVASCERFLEPPRGSLARILRESKGPGGETRFSALGVLLMDDSSIGPNSSLDNMLLEGGPGQGKSTLTQMLVQIYRAQILRHSLNAEGRWSEPTKRRLPFRVELKSFGEICSAKQSYTLEMYLADQISNDSGGTTFTVESLQAAVANCPVLLILDGLDEVGSDELRDRVLDCCRATWQRLREGLNCDLRVVLTTRPPALAGRHGKLENFSRLQILPMSRDSVEEFLKRWTEAQLAQVQDRNRVTNSFLSRQQESHVDALARNPMQLSVLLHLIYFKGEAFPDRRAELYREYFDKVIDRDVEKSEELRGERDTVEALHKFIGYQLHALTGSERADGSLLRPGLLQMVRRWLEDRKDDPKKAERLFQLGEERLGLIMVLRGEGNEAQYGFDVQPIREYFAAAYVNDELDEDASDLFARMVRQSYWREVAIFLAGLRRPKEKADLIAKARELDRDETWGWRQDGREIILQLLKEGVLNQPPYVFLDGVGFMLDLLDQTQVEHHREPEDFVRVLKSLMPQHQSSISGRVRRLLEGAIEETNRYGAIRALAVAMGALRKSEIARYLMKYEGDDAFARADARVVWPQEISFSPDRPGYWVDALKDLPEKTVPNALAEALVRGDFRPGAAVEQEFQESLLYLFAVEPLLLWNRFGEASSKLGSGSAVRSLGVACMGLCETVFSLSRQGSLHASLGWGGGRESDRLGETAWGGLGSVENLPKASEEVVRSCFAAVAETREALGELEAGRLNAAVEGVKRLIGESEESFGLEYWVYWRTIALVIDVLRITEMFFVYKDSSKGRELKAPRGNLERILHRRNSEFMHRYASRAVRPRPEEIKRGFMGALVYGSGKSRRLIPDGLSYVMPGHVRMRDGTVMDSGAAVANLLTERVSAQLDWLHSVPLGGPVLKVALSSLKDKSELEFALENLGHASFRPMRRGGSLRTADLHRVAAIARRSQNSETLRGCAYAISCSKFMKIVEPEVVAKLLKAVGSRSWFFCGLFDGTLAAAGHVAISERLLAVANLIVEDFSEFPLDIGCAAAEYIARHGEVEFPPIFEGVYEGA